MSPGDILIGAIGEKFLPKIKGFGVIGCIISLHTPNGQIFLELTMIKVLNSN